MHSADEFQKGLVRSNKLHSYFVKWDKARQNALKFRDELSLLKNLSTEGIEPEVELRRLLIAYPNILPLISLLTAVRIEKPPLVVLDDDRETEIEYFFDAHDDDETAINSTVEYAKRTGLLKELTTLTDPFDYYFGVEVGSDTNARKNRSGTAMEELIEPYVEEFVAAQSGKWLSQKTFKYCGNEWGVSVPDDQANKKGDFMLLLDGVPTNIETNFFGGGGSKQEVLESYYTRQADLKKAGWGFALVTDGLGWTKNRVQIEKAFRRIDHVLNVKMVKEGCLKELL